jgi:hypothetical protein
VRVNDQEIAMRKDPLKGIHSISGVYIAFNCGDLTAAGHYKRGMQIVQKEMERLLRIDRMAISPADRDRTANEIREGNILMEKLQGVYNHSNKKRG